MIKKNTYPTITESVKEALEGIGKVKNVSSSMRQFDKLQFPTPKQYSAKDIQKLRKKLMVSQAVFAHLINARLTTVQKWERGVNQPSGPINRLLELVERYGLSVLSRK